MSKSKIVSTLVYLINFGISSDKYYSTTQHDLNGSIKKNKLEGSKAFWDKDKKLCFTVGNKTYKFVLEEEDEKNL